MGRYLTLLLAAMAGQSAAHFLLNDPPSIGFNDDDESSAPCGGFTPDFSKNNVTTFHVGGDSISTTSTHPTTTWLFRATLDQTAGGNWTNLLNGDAIKQNGLGDFCEPDVAVPSSWAGQKGIINVVADSPDGILYQCAAVNFVNGTGTAPSSCKNASDVSVATISDAALSSLPASSSPTSSSKPHKNSAPTSYTVMGPVIWAGTVVLGTVYACLI